MCSLAARPCKTRAKPEPTGGHPESWPYTYRPDSYQADSHPADSHPADSQPAGSHPADSHPADSHPADSHPAALCPSVRGIQVFTDIRSFLTGSAEALRSPGGRLSREEYVERMGRKRAHNFDAALREEVYALFEVMGRAAPSPQSALPSPQSALPSPQSALPCLPHKHAAPPMNECPAPRGRRGSAPPSRFI